MARLEDHTGCWLELTPLRPQFAGSADAWDSSWIVARFTVFDGDREWSSDPPEIATLMFDELRSMAVWLEHLSARISAQRGIFADEWEALEPSIGWRATFEDSMLRIHALLNRRFRPPESNDGIVWPEPHVVSFAPTAAQIERFALQLGAEAALAAAR